MRNQRPYKGPCTVEFCSLPIYARGWCDKHYQRVKAHGSPHVNKKKKSPVWQFWRQINKDGPLPRWAPFLGPCWLWTGELEKSGYGMVTANSRRYRAHRLSMLFSNRRPHSVRHTDHMCRVRACVNPDHLEMVTQAENNARTSTVPRTYRGRRV